MSLFGDDFGGAGARETTCPRCRADLIEAFHHGTTHRIAPARVTRDCPECGAPDAILIFTARSHGRTGNAEVYRAAFAPPWVRARLPQRYEGGSSVLRDLRHPAAAIPLGLAALLMGLWVRESGWVNVRPIVLGLAAGAGVCAVGFRFVVAPLLARRPRGQGDLLVWALLVVSFGAMIAVVLAVG